MALRRTLVYFLAFIFLSTAEALGAGPKEPQIDVGLLAEKTALVPGETVALAVAFKIESGWHIYWQNRGEEGLEPTFAWQLPPGFEVGPMRFPPPRRHVDSTGANTFILEGEPVILTQLSVPASAKPGEKVAIGVNVGWLACKDACVRGGKRLSIELPVVADENKVENFDPLTFKSAIKELPAAPGKAKYLSELSALASVDKIRPGDRLEVAVVMEVQPGHHTNSHTPLEESLIPTDVFPTRTEGLTIGRVRFPPGQNVDPMQSQAGGFSLSPAEETRAGEDSEKLSLYRGKVVFRIPVEASESLKGDSVHIGGVVTYQVCSDVTNQCFPPTSAEWDLTLPVAKAGEAVKMVALPGSDLPEAPTAVKAPEPSARPVQKDRGEPAAIAQTAPPASGESSADSLAIGVLSRIGSYLASLGVMGYVILAFAGGLLMNLMPCVLPVISIKVLSFVQQAKESRWRVLTLGLSFAAGIQVSFIVLGLLILGLLKGLGFELQWGGLLQKPIFLISLAAIVMALALSLFGVFTLSPPKFVMEMGGRVEQEGHVNAFAMGLLATLLGTACTAPGIGLAVPWAATQSPAVGMLIFTIAGFGMALPYVLLAAKPAWLKFIPRPGPWMETFEHVMGFLLLGTVAFLLNPLAYQIGGDGLLWTIVFLLFVAAAAWCYGRVGLDAGTTRQAICYSGTVLLILSGWWLCFRFKSNIPDLVARQQALVKGTVAAVRTDWPDSGEIPWVPYTRERTLDLVNAGKTVFIDYTAEWCVNCKYNEKLVINTPEVREAMRRMGVVPVRADYTSPDPEIRADLERFHRAGVPMYVIIPAHHPDEPILLSEILTQASVLEGLERAGPSAGAAVSMADSGR
jgi:thiol:disulfide interchange protein